jgi:hypothetical protein
MTHAQYSSVFRNTLLMCFVRFWPWYSCMTHFPSTSIFSSILFVGQMYFGTLALYPTLVIELSYVADLAYKKEI